MRYPTLTSIQNHKEVKDNIEDKIMNMSFPQSLYFYSLKEIQGILFTRREIDIIACILSGRAAKKIAAFLSISPRTVENYIRNIMIKIGCGSQEQIIDFIEKSNKFTLIKKHYSALLIQATFEKELKKALGSTDEKAAISCTLICNKEQTNEMIFIRQLEEYLKLFGIKVTVDTKQEYGNTINFTRSSETNATHFIIHVLSEPFIEQFNVGVTSTKSEAQHFSQWANENKDSILLFLLDKKDSTIIPNELLEFQHVNSKEHRNYYFLIFAIFKKLLPHINFEKNISGFKNQSETFVDHNENHVILKETNPDSPDFTVKNILKNQFKKVNTKILLGGTVICVLISTLMFNRNLNVNDINANTQNSVLKLQAFLNSEDPHSNKP